MSKNSADRWLQDARSRRSPSGNLDVSRLLATWFSDDAWRADVTLMPAPARRTFLAELGREFFDGNIGNVADELMWNLARVEWLWPPAELRRLGRDHTAHLFSALSDSLDFHAGTADLSCVDYINWHHLTEALGGRKGTLLVGAFQSHPGFLLSAPDLGAFKVAVVRKSGATDQASLTLAGLTHVEELPASTGAVRRMLALLSQGQVVATYGDYVYAGSATIESALFGYRTTLSRSLIRIAMRTGASLIPFAIARTAPEGRSAVAVELFPPINLDEPDENTLALRLGVALECLIRRYPAQWRLWNTLRSRCY